jgi:hypothetical protein
MVIHHQFLHLLHHRAMFNHHNTVFQFHMLHSHRLLCMAQCRHNRKAMLLQPLFHMLTLVHYNNNQCQLHLRQTFIRLSSRQFMMK